MIKIPRREPQTKQVIVIHKVTERFGLLPVGAKYEWSYTSCTRDMAVERAKAAVIREYPDERRVDWEPKPDAVKKLVDESRGLTST